MKQTPMSFKIDDILPLNPDVRTFGLNLTCSWPLPSPLAETYQQFSARVRGLDPALYVYPYPETHITVMTLINFKDTLNIDSKQQAKLESLADNIVSCLKTMFPLQSTPKDKLLQLKLNKAVLTEAAGYLLFDDPTDQINRLRDTAERLLAKDLPELHPSIPHIVHSTFVRFLGAPRDPIALRKDFETLSSTLEPVVITIPEIFLSIETKPYMRSGTIRHVFPL